MPSRPFQSLLMVRPVRSRAFVTLAAILLPLLMIAVLPPPALAQIPEPVLAADAFESAFLTLSRQHLKAPPSQDLLQAAVGGLSQFLRDRGFVPPAVTLSGLETRDVTSIRDAILRIAARMPSLSPYELAYASIDGMVRSIGDPFTRLVHPTLGPPIRRSPPGYSGIGIILQTDAHPPVVAEVFDGGPAGRAGVRPGDVIVEIDGQPTAAMPIQEVINRLRGLPGTSVTLRIRRGESDLVVTITREVIGLRHVTYRRIDVVGYVRLTDFGEGAGDEVTAAVAEMQREGARAIVLDIRGNPGGFVDEAVRVASIFLRGGVVTMLVNRAGERTTYRVNTNGYKFPGPVAVLVDRDSASASEIVAGALLDGGHGIIGSRTYGKGTVQVSRRLPGGAILRVTVAQYLTPNGATVDGQGIHPSLEVASAGTFGTPDDRVLQAAVDWLTTRAGALRRLLAA